MSDTLPEAAERPQQHLPALAEGDRPLVRHQRSLVVKNLSPALPERGKIKIGMKGAEITSRSGAKFQPPKKLDHFLITTMERGPDGNFKRDDELHKIYGEKPTSIDVRLIYDDPMLNFPTRYAAYAGTRLWCAGDGEVAMRLNDEATAKRTGETHRCVACPCHRQAFEYQGNDKCKINGVLSVLIDKAPGIGGVWKFRTTSHNSVNNLLSSVAFIKGITGGPLANVPLKLVVRPKQATDPSGKKQVIQVVSLEYAGDLEALRDKGHEIALQRAQTHVRIELVEREARKLLAPPLDVPLPGDDGDDVRAEFYHEAEPTDSTTQASGTTAKAQLGAFAGDTPDDKPPLGPTEPPAERYEMYDETGHVECVCTSIDQWAKELLAAATDKSKGHAYLRKNRALFVQRHLDISDEIVNKLAVLYGTLPDEPTEPAAQGRGEGPAGEKVASAPPAGAAPDKTKPTPLPMKDKKVQVGEYIRLVNTEIGEAPTAEAVDAILKREEPNFKKLADSVGSGIRLRAGQRKAEISQGAPAEQKSQAPTAAQTGPLWRYIPSKGDPRTYPTLDDMTAGLTKLIAKGNAEQVKAALDRNKPVLDDIRQRAGEDAALAIVTVFHDRIKAAEAEGEL